MVAKRSPLVVAVFLVVVPAVTLTHAQGSEPSKRIVTTPRSQPNQGLVDFALKGVNAGDQDYGQCMEEGRRLLIQETVNRVDFWSNILAISAAFVLFVIVIHQRRFQQRCEQTAAESLTQYHNALVRAQEQILAATERNHALAKTLSNPSDQGHPGLSTVDNEASGGPKQPRRQVARSARTEPPPEVKQSLPAPPETAAVQVTGQDSGQSRVTPGTTGQTTTTTDQMGLFGSDVDLVAKINSLQQQLKGSQEREKRLRQQLSDAEIRFQKEQEKARSLRA